MIKETLAIAKAVSKSALKQAREELAPGAYDVDTIVHIKGQLHIGEDEQYTPTGEVPIKDTLALFMRYCGVTREHAAAALLRAMNDATAAKYTGDARGLMIKNRISQSQAVVDAAIKCVKETLEELEPKTRAGKVISDLEVTITKG